VRVGAQQHPRDERLPGPCIQENHRVRAHRPLKRLQLVPARMQAFVAGTSVTVRRASGGTILTISVASAYPPSVLRPSRRRRSHPWW
jgi:hypothetical protein